MSTDPGEPILLTIAQATARLPDDEQLGALMFTHAGHLIGRSIEEHRGNVMQLLAAYPIAVTHPWWLERGYGLVVLAESCFYFVRTETEVAPWDPTPNTAYPSPLSGETK